MDYKAFDAEMRRFEAERRMQAEAARYVREERLMHRSCDKCINCGGSCCYIPEFQKLISLEDYKARCPGYMFYD